MSGEREYEDKLQKIFSAIKQVEESLAILIDMVNEQSQHRAELAKGIDVLKVDVQKEMDSLNRLVEERKKLSKLGNTQLGSGMFGDTQLHFPAIDTWDKDFQSYNIGREVVNSTTIRKMLDLKKELSYDEILKQIAEGKIKGTQASRILFNRWKRD